MHMHILIKNTVIVGLASIRPVDAAFEFKLKTNNT